MYFIRHILFLRFGNWIVFRLTSHNTSASIGRGALPVAITGQSAPNAWDVRIVLFYATYRRLHVSSANNQGVTETIRAGEH